jgi:heme A synthase
MIAEFIGLLTIVLGSLDLAFRAPSLDAQSRALAALGTVILQGFLGGMTVLYFLPPLVSSAHAALGQTFFCLTCCIAMFTGRKWVRGFCTACDRYAHTAAFSSRVAIAGGAVYAVDPGRYVSPSWHELGRACCQCARGRADSYLDVRSRAVAIWRQSGGAAASGGDSVFGEHPVVLGISCVSHADRVGRGRAPA